MTLSSARHESPDWESAVEACFEHGWSDGLPVIPATEERVARFVEASRREADDVVLREPVRRRTITVEKIAINAVMAGCRPQYMPVLLAALEAMGDPAFNLHGSITSTGGAATLVVVNGPVAARLGFNASGNIFGPGWRANATIGRAVRLVTLNCLGAQPGILDRSTQGHPGKYTFCIAEREDASPWPPFHVDRGFTRETSVVTVFAGEGPHNVLSHYGSDAESILVAIADTMAALGSFSPGESFLVLAPEHVERLASDGWTKPKIREWVYAHACRTGAELKRGGKLTGDVAEGDSDRRVHRGRGPEDIHVLVGGGDAGGHSAFIPSWSRERLSLAVSRAIEDNEP